MACPDAGVLGQNLTFTIQARTASGVDVDAASLPTYKVYEDNTDTAIATGTMAKLDDAGTTGFYSAVLAVSSSNGYERYKTYNIRISATVATVAVTKTYSFIVLAGTDEFTATTGALTTLANVQQFGNIPTGVDETLLTNLIARATDAIQTFTDRDLLATTYREFYGGDSTRFLPVNQFPIISIQMLSVSRVDAFSITNTSSDAYNAYIQITDSQMILVVQGGVNAGTETLTLSDSATITALLSAISGLSKGWSTIITTVYANWSPTELIPVSGLSALTNSSAGVSNTAYPSLPDLPEWDFDFDANPGIVKRKIGVFPSGSLNIMIKYTAGYATTPADLEQIAIDLTLVYYRKRKRDPALLKEKLGDYSYEKNQESFGIPKDIQGRLQPYRRITFYA